MISGLSLLQVAGLALLAGVGFVASTAMKLILEREYGSWAPALARLLTRIAGSLDRRRRGEWWADLLYDQKIKGEACLFQAASCLATASWSALLMGVVAAAGPPLRLLRRRRGISWTVTESELIIGLELADLLALGPLEDMKLNSARRRRLVQLLNIDLSRHYGTPVNLRLSGTDGEAVA